MKVAVSRLGFGVKPLDDSVIAYQQSIADTFHKLGLLPKPLVVKDVVLRLPGSAS